MGSPISVALAELVMQRIEKQIFSSSPFEIPVNGRDMFDDIFSIIPADNFFQLTIPAWYFSEQLINKYP